MSFVVPTLLKPAVVSEPLFSEPPHHSTELLTLVLRSLISVSRTQHQPDVPPHSRLPLSSPVTSPASNLRTSENPEICLWWILFSVTSQYLLVLSNIMALAAMRIRKALKGLFLTQTFPLDSGSIDTYLTFPSGCLLIISNITCHKLSSQHLPSQKLYIISLSFSSNTVMGAPHEFDTNLCSSCTYHCAPSFPTHCLSFMFKRELTDPFSPRTWYFSGPVHVISHGE